jgi:hypothetical protein
MGSFGEALARTLADRWAAVAAPALAFWAAGVGAYLLAHDGSWTRFREWFEMLDGALQLAVAAGALALVAVSAAGVEWLVRPATHALEGYWPGLSRLQWLLNRRRTAQLTRAEQRWDALVERVGSGAASWDERQAFAEADATLRRVPAAPDARMPTSLGDVLRAAELWPQLKYGLEPIACFPRLWLVLPDVAREELSAARTGLDRSIGVVLWSLLLIVWTPWAWWAPLMGMAIAIGVYRAWVLTAARVYADLLESSFDVHRLALYDAVGLDRPAILGDELADGERLTAFLWRGTLPPSGAEVGETAPEVR